MSMKLFELKKQHAHALGKADHIVKAAEDAGREMTPVEALDFDTSMAASRAIGAEIKRIQAGIPLSEYFPKGVVITDGGRRHTLSPAPRVLSAEYQEDFFAYIATKGQQVSAALYEGAGSAGGYTVPSMVDGQIVPLAPTDMGVRTIATVIPTVMDMKIPVATTISTTAAKAESGASVTTFTESDPVLAQFTLSAFMAGLTHTISWELAQDVPSFQAFAVGDMLLSQSLFEEAWYVTGTGTGQPQGLIGNVGAGVTGETADANGNLLSIDATFDVMGTLKGAYHNNASWLMQRSAGIELRKAQKQSNLFEPVFTRSNGQDYLHGYPVVYSTAMPAVAAGATPVLFGDFKQGYVIGDRGGAGINVKILDQPLATQGLVVLLAYRRTDGRVRRSEAIQGITLHT